MNKISPSVCSRRKTLYLSVSVAETLDQERLLYVNRAADSGERMNQELGRPSAAYHQRVAKQDDRSERGGLCAIHPLTRVVLT